MSEQNTQPQADAPGAPENQPAATNQQPPANAPDPKGGEAPASENAPAPGEPAQPAGDDAAAKAAAEKAEADRKALIEQTQKDAQAKAKADMDAAVASWKDAVAKDPDLGGAKAEATKVDVQAGLKALKRGEGLQKLFEATGLIHHPDVVGALAEVGRMTREGRFVSGTPPKDKPKTLAERLYDKTPSQ